MKHIKQILQDAGLLVDKRTQVIGIDGQETYEHDGDKASDELLEAVGETFLFSAPSGWIFPRAVVVNPITGVVEQIVLLEERCSYVPVDQVVG